jgi:hypothetical protein
VGTDASFNYLGKEYGDPDSEIASMSAVAILKSGHKNAFKVVTAGFDRGGGWTPGAKVRVLDALARSEGTAGFDFVVKTATKGSDELKVLALGSLALRPDDKRGLDILLKALEDRSLLIRKAALRAVKPLGAKALVSPLIERLAKETDPQLRIDVAQSLVDRTGQNMGLEALDWKKWWEGAQADFGEGQRPPAKGGTSVVTAKLAYHGIGVTSKRLSFLVDASGSMLEGLDGRGGPRGFGPGGPGGAGGAGGEEGVPIGSRKLDFMKRELTRILKELPEDTQVNIIPFNRAPQPWKKELHSLKGRGRDEAVQFVRELTTDYATNIYDTLELALKDDRVDTLYLLTDGLPMGGKYTETADILREVGALNRLRNARIHCIGFGLEAAFLKDLASQNGGDFRMANNQAEAGAGKESQRVASTDPPAGPPGPP